MRTWLSQHGFAARDALWRFGRQFFPTLLNVIVIGVALSLPLALYVAIKNVAPVTGQLSSEPQLTLFMDPDATAAESEAIGKRLQAHPKVGGQRFVDKGAALEALKRAAGMAEIVNELGRNPLPDAWVVRGRGSNPAALEDLRTEAARWPGVDYAQLDTDWARKLDAAVRVGQAVTLLFAGLLSVALVAVTFNTIRLQILTRREEIEVSKLIGATDGFVRRPFLYFGAIQGLAGGITACALVTLALGVLDVQLAATQLALAPEGGILRLELREVGAVLLGAGALGWLGAWLSVSRHLWRTGLS
jgi:cell division transport system permease protein